MSSEHEHARTGDAAEQEPATGDGESDAPLTDGDIETHQNQRADLRASYDGDGSKDLSIDDD